MNARPILDRTIWNVMCDGEIEAFATREEAQRAVDSWLDWNAEPTVVEFNVAEGRAYDVTIDFLPDEDDEHDDATGIPSPAELLREHMGRAL